jgi:hypothetical protein
MTGPPRRSASVARRAAALVALLVAGCTDGGTQDGSASTSSTIPLPQTLLRVGVEEWPDCLNPLTCDSEALREQVLQHVLPGLFEVQPDNDLRPSPLLAGEPELALSDGVMTVTYRLDPDARWNDGRPVTSSDIRGTWQAILATPGADRTGYDRIASIDDRDPLVAVMTFRERYAEWRQLFGAGMGWVLQADAFGGDLDLTDRFETELPFSAAPYRLAAWDPDGAVLAAVEDHWAEARRPGIDQVRLSQVDFDVLDDPGPYDLLIPSGRPGAAPAGFVRRDVGTTSVVGVWFDQRTPLLAPLEHRKALVTGMDRRRLARVFAGEDATTIGCLGWVPSVGPWCEAGRADLPETDRELARFALALAGWSPSPSGTLARPGGEFFAVPLVTDPAVTGATALADAVGESLAAIGVGTERFDVGTETWSAPRPPAQAMGVGVFALDLGLSPLVTELYGCPGGLDSSVIAWCPRVVVEAARDLRSAVREDEARAMVDIIGGAAGAAATWVPVAPLEETAFVRDERVRAPERSPVVGGALADLHSWEMDG